MKKSKYIILLSLGYCVAITGFSQNMIPVDGILFGRPFQTNVDHHLAKEMLANPNDSSVVQFFSDYGNHALNTETLSDITQKYSMDVASLFFVEKIYGQGKNRRLQDYYLSTTESFSNGQTERSLSFLQNYFIVFVPGFRYRHVHNGSNFSDQRLMLDSDGIAYEMIDIEETGLVEDNAKIIVNRLQELNIIHNNIVIISVSKGGLETALALEKLYDSQNLSSTKAWINVGGILKGTPVADRWSKPFMRFWLARGLHWKRIKVNLKGLLNDMSYELGKEKYKSVKIPPSINTINFIAVPLLHQEKKSVFTSPNDGFSPLTDAITEDGSVVVEMGVDHFFRGVDMNNAMVALLQYIVENQE